LKGLLIGMQALVTGATGLLGRHLVNVLAEAGMQVRALVRGSSDTSHLANRGVELIIGGAGDGEAIGQAVAGVDLVFHVAGYLTANAPFGTDDNQADGEWPVYKAINVDFTEALLGASLDVGVGRFVYVSSSSVYDVDAPVPTAENAPLQPFSIYGRSKLMAEEKVCAFQAKGLATTIIRPPIVYGPGDRYFTPMALRLTKLPVLPLINGGRNLMDMVYVGDVAELMWLASGRETAVGEAYNAGPGQPTSIHDLVHAYRGITGSLRPFIVPVSLQASRRTAWLSRRLVKPFIAEAGSALTPQGLTLMSRDLHLDMGKAARDLGFQPGVDLYEGLALTLRSGERRVASGA
jgi:nucleoside-diphosphate-sugar epimerase